MTPALITAIISAVTAVVAGLGAFAAWQRSNRLAESQVITVTVEAAENVVHLVTAQLDRSMKDYEKLAKRVNAMEEALAKEQGRNLQLQLQLGKVRKRVQVLEDFIHSKGFVPPPPGEDEEVS
jgi:Mg2+ and Co2+ transporter CorA